MCLVLSEMETNQPQQLTKMFEFTELFRDVAWQREPPVDPRRLCHAPDTACSDHTSRTNWTLGVKHAWVWCTLSICTPMAQPWLCFGRVQSLQAALQTVAAFYCHPEAGS